MMNPVPIYTPRFRERHPAVRKGRLFFLSTRDATTRCTPQDGTYEILTNDDYVREEKIGKVKNDMFLEE